MPDQTEIPVSSFPDAQSINGGDKVTGLQNNSNTNFTFSSILSWLVNAVRAVFVPVTRTVNGKTLDTNITLNASDVGARPSTWTPSVTDIGAQPVIAASGILMGDGAGGVAAATAGTDYATPSQIPSVPSAYTSNPAMDGTASPGSSGAWARGDHVHPSDTSRIPTTEKGAANGVASLDSAGKVPSSQLPAIPTTAAGVSYDNTASGLAADDVQEAIDELAAGAGGGGVDPETIAPVEDTTTATVAHPLGWIFYLNGILYRALSDIAVGGTINTASGGNATQTTVAQNFKRTVTLTSAQYAQLSAAEKSADIVYIITDDNAISADDVDYDNTASGLTAMNVQDAIDEVYGDIPSQPSDIGAQDTITASGILKGDGAGGVSAATPGTDYQAPLTFDATPTASSTNPVQSGGVYTDVRTRVPVIGMGKNLLDNWYFLNPVNQRGATSGSAGYCIDRWKASYGSGGVSWSLTSDGLSYQPVNTSSYGYIAQVIDSDVLSFIVGKRIHVHAITSSGDMLGGTIIYAANATIFDDTYSSHRVRMRFSGNELRIESFASALILKCVKFELGAEQTFAHLESSIWVPNSRLRI